MNSFALPCPKHKTMITTLNKISRELLKVRHGIDSNLRTQQLGLDQHSFMLELQKKKEVG